MAVQPGETAMAGSAAVVRPLGHHVARVFHLTKKAWLQAPGNQWERETQVWMALEGAPAWVKKARTDCT